MKATKLKQRLYSVNMHDNDGFFRDYILDSVQPDFHILDAGAGGGEKFPYDLKDRCQEMIGVDLDPRVVDNPQLNRGVVADLTKTPFENETFDLIFSRYVMEHVQAPPAFLAEMNRILKPDAQFIFLTPNKYHYVSLIAAITPDRCHSWYNKTRGRQEDDTFPTVYRLNSTRSIRNEMTAVGFTENQIIYRECSPNYLMFSRIAFLLGVAYERFVNASNFFQKLRVNIIGSYTKKAD